MNRDYQSFEWFVELLGQLELQQMNSRSLERFINIHLYMTSAKCVQEIKPSVFSELNSTTQLNEFSLKIRPGRPNLDHVSRLDFICTYFKNLIGVEIFQDFYRNKLEKKG